MFRSSIEDMSLFKVLTKDDKARFSDDLNMFGKYSQKKTKSGLLFKKLISGFVDSE